MDEIHNGVEERVYDVREVREGPVRVGFLVNVKTSKIIDDENVERTVLLLYFAGADGNWWKSFIFYRPYFFIKISEERTTEMIGFLERKFEKKLASVEVVSKVDLELPNHLSGIRSSYLKLSFRTVADLMLVRKELAPRAFKNRLRVKNETTMGMSFFEEKRTQVDLLDEILDIREYDVPYHTRVMIDLDIRCSLWYKMQYSEGFISKIECIKEKVERPHLRIMAFDIETSKMPLKFPDARYDQIMMISYMIDHKAYLIVNRSIVSSDIKDFTYSATAEFEADVQVFNEENEFNLLKKWFSHIRESKPFVITSFNGDKFDWPFIQTRCESVGLSLLEKTGVSGNENEEFYGRFVVHLDCYYWVQRDAYLPQGSHGLKAVTKAKLSYEPIELEPELMVPYARQRPQELAEYSVSDAIATYYIYKKHIHDFIFALSTIIPMGVDEVLRKGSGTLCEALLMAEAYKRTVIFPNKKTEKLEKFFEGHLLDSETYIGGHVECLQNGVYRSDIPTKFNLQPSAFHMLMTQLENVINFCARIENGANPDDIINMGDVKAEISSKLEKFRDLSTPHSHDAKPLVYHVDVAAMYPNIILTNRLQPVSIVNDNICSSCLYNLPENNCKRHLSWEWKIEYFPLSRSEYDTVKASVDFEEINKQAGGGWVSENVQMAAVKKRVKTYCQKTYKRVHVPHTQVKEDLVCMRENSFYVETVRAFRDRRYEFKGLVKIYKGKMDEANSKGDVNLAQEHEERMALYESLQLAHKIILNSFYGYVMRKGARWYSMEMAAMVTYTGSEIIQNARSLLEKIGKPLELDTDGVWCLLPEGFPENFSIKMKNGKTFRMSYPCTMLNMLIYDKYKNEQYQELQPNGRFDTRTEMSVFFEIDGPYKAMVIPAALEENKVLKKRYAIFNNKGGIQEIKGFEIKRRGELKIIKVFQSDVFEQFLKGSTLKECYEACGEAANKWLTLLKEHGGDLDESELLEYIMESRMTSKTLEEYDSKKSVVLTVANRMSEFLGEDIIKGKGLNCTFVVATKPVGLPINERVIPVSIFSAEENIKRKFLKKWLRENEMTDFEMRNIVDWDYYIERLGKTIHKMVSIPAALQGIANPVPSLPFPEWLQKKLHEVTEAKQRPTKKLTNYFTAGPTKPGLPVSEDIEDIMTGIPSQGKASSDGGKGIVITNKGKTGKSSCLKLTPGKLAPKETLGALAAKPETSLNPFNMRTDFDEWLAHSVETWSKNRVKSKITRKQDLESINVPDGANRLKGFFREHDMMVRSSVWNIIQAQETETPGVFRLWVLLENEALVQVKVNVPRVVYVHSLVEEASSSFKRVNKRLPRERGTAYLYECELPEEQYQESVHKFDYFLTNPNYEGVYEHNVTPLFRLLSFTGNRVMLSKSSPRYPKSYTSTVYELKDLEQQFGSSSQYLPSFSVAILFLGQIALSPTKKVLCLFNTVLNELNVYFVHNSFDVPDRYPKFIKDIFLKFFQENEELPILNVATLASTAIRVSNYKKEEEVFAEINNNLEKYISGNPKGGSLLVIGGCYPHLSEYVNRGLRTIGQEFPSIVLRTTENHGIPFSSLEWKKSGIRFLCEYFLTIPDELDELLGLCRYADLPLGNMEEDRLNFVTDVFMFRAISASNCLSWYSESTAPDLGGANHHDVSGLEFYNPNSMEYGQSTSSFTIVCDIELSMLTLNMLLVSDELKNLDREASALVDNYHDSLRNGKGFDKNSFRLFTDEFYQGKTAFKFFKLLIKGWFRDASEFENKYADELVQNFHRYISCEKAKHFDPCLRSLINKLTGKVFTRLLSAFASLGVKVLFANSTKILIDSGKETAAAAENSISFVLNTISGNPLFRYVNMKVTQYWRSIFFKDSYNFCAITSDNKRHFRWSEAERLPQQIKNVFMWIVLRYMEKVLKKKQVMLSGLSTVNSLAFIQPEQLEQLSLLKRDYLKKKLTPKIYEILDELRTSIEKCRIRAEDIMNQKRQRVLEEQERINQGMEVESEQKEREDMDYDEISNDEEDNASDLGSFIDDGEDPFAEVRTKKHPEEPSEIENQDPNKPNHKDQRAKSEIKRLREENDDPETEEDLEIREIHKYIKYNQVFGSKPTANHPVVDLVNMVSSVLKLDKDLEAEIVALKGNCFSLIKECRLLLSSLCYF